MAFFSHMRRVTKSKVTIGSLKNSNNEMIIDNKGMCGLLNEYFCTVFSEENKEIIPDPEIAYNGTSPLSHIFFDQKIIADNLRALRPSSAPSRSGLSLA